MTNRQKKNIYRGGIRRRFVKRLTMLVSMLVIFSTTYMLILPAIAIDRQAAGSEPGLDAGAVYSLACQYKPHTHTEDCYIERDILDAEGNPAGKRITPRTCTAKPVIRTVCLSARCRKWMPMCMTSLVMRPGRR